MSCVGDPHLSFKVRKKNFAYYLDNHHADGEKIALSCKAPPGEQAPLLESDPERYFVPAYVGPRGWIENG